MSSGLVIALAVASGIAVPVVLVSLAILAPKTPRRALWFIGDVAEFTLFLFVAAIIFIVAPGPGFGEIPKCWRDLRSRHDISHKPS